MNRLFVITVSIALLSGALSAVAQTKKADFPFPEHFSRVQKLALFLESSVNAETYYTYCISQTHAQPEGQLAENLEFLKKAYLQIYKEKARMEDDVAKQTLENDLGKLKSESLNQMTEDTCKGPDKLWHTQYEIFRSADPQYLAHQLNKIFEQDK